MQTWKDVFKSKEEQQNLKHIGFCVLIVVALVIGSFSATGLRDFFQASRETPTQLQLTETANSID